MELDSRVRKPRGIKALARQGQAIIFGEPVYCLSCGCQDGYVTVGLPPGVFYLCGFESNCGHECETKFGIPPEMITRPDIDEARVNG